jgi:signal transduction histidine kinase
MTAKLLFVDDEPRLESLVRQLFRKEIRDGVYHVEFAQNGRDALNRLQTDSAIDILLTDLNMPRMSGLALLSELQTRKADLNPILTSIVISAYGDMGNIRKAMNAGAFDFLTKPLDFEDMRLTISKAIEHVRRLRHSIEQEARATDALHQMNQELERRVQKRTQQLKKSNGELNAFAHTVAHDLKNPLGIITGYVDYAIDFFDELEQDELLETLTDVRQFTYKSINIIDELLLLSGVRKLDVPRMPVDMRELVENAQRRLRSMAQEYQAEISITGDWPLATGYPPWIEEVWVNYVSNGLKYGGNPPRLELGSEPTGNGMIRFWVKDNGPGLSVEDQQKLFTEFTRLNDTRVRGYGLGLSIVRRIIEKLGGEVGVESEPGHGCKFYFTLPAAKS